MALCALMACRAAGPAWSADDAMASPLPPADGQALDGAVDFDIPALALGDALKHYAAQTRQPALFRSELLAQLSSSAVQGRYTPDDALRLLLEGTGLVAEKVRTGSGVTIALKAAPRPATGPHAASLGSLAGYPSLVQAQVWQALCGDARARPGAYRSLLRFEVDAAGRLRRARLLGSTGDALRDAAVLQALQRVRLPHAPPADLPQPLTLLVLPANAGDADGDRCRAAAVGDAN